MKAPIPVHSTEDNMKAVAQIPISMRPKTMIIARWESRGRKYWLELTKEWLPDCEPAYSYSSDNGGGFIGHPTEERAIAYCAQQASYAPSKMKRVL